MPPVCTWLENEALRCIKDWISTVLVLTPVACNISGKENAMGIWCDIPSHPTQGHAYKFLICSYLQSVLAELLICRSNCSHFSSWIQVSLPSTGFSVGGWSSAREFPRHGENRLQKFTHTQTIFVFLLRIIALPILQPTIHSSMCCSSFVNVALTCPLFLQIGNTLRKSRHAWQQ